MIMDICLTKSNIEHEIAGMLKSNELMKLAAKSVGYDVDAETEKVDKRIRLNIYQKARMQFLNSLLEKPNDKH